MSLDLVQVIKLLSNFIYFTVFRLSYWLLISNPVHNAFRAIEIGALFNLAKTLVLVPHTKKCQVKKPKYKKVGGQAAEDPKTKKNFQLVIKPSWIGPHKVLQLSLFDTVFYLLVKNKKRGGGGGVIGVKRDGGLLLKLSSTEKEGLFERGDLNRGFKRCKKKH